ncbi:hypothetical protein FRB99_005697 [Tulasnella sp. 403]|nr:hypothetical protein FRB99_005697 [Tulasnella sp. 403]
MHLQVLGLHSILLMLAITFVPPSACNSIYNLKKLTVGADFFDDFEFQTMDDPTHGRVNYVNASTAIQKRLAYTSNGGRQFTMRADSTNSVQPGQRGRDSVRIASKDVYQDVRQTLTCGPRVPRTDALP